MNSIPSLNRLAQTIQSHVSSLPADNVSSTTAYTLSQLLSARLYEESQNAVRSWLDRVSASYTIEFPYLQRDWENYNFLVQQSRKHKITEEMDTDENDAQKRMKFATKEFSVMDKIEEMAQKIITHFNPTIGRFVHDLTGMTFISKEEPKVFARWDGEKLVPLTDDDVEVCQVYRFHYVPDRFTSEMAKMTTMTMMTKMTKASSAAESFSSLDQS